MSQLSRLLIVNMALVLVAAACSNTRAPKRPSLTAQTVSAEPALAKPADSKAAGFSDTKAVDDVIADSGSAGAKVISTDAAAPAPAPVAVKPAVATTGVTPNPSSTVTSATPGNSSSPTTATSAAQATPVNPTPVKPAEESKPADAKSADATKPAPAAKLADGETITAKPVAAKKPIVAGDPVGVEASDAAMGPAMNRNQECALPYRRESNDWFPGLPRPPIRDPRFTGGADRLGNTSADEIRRNPSLGLQYTDAATDHLMDMASGQAINHDSRRVQLDSQLAMRIDDVHLYTDIQGTGRVQLRFTYVAGQGQAVPVQLEGQFRDRRAQSRTAIRLTQAQSPLTGEFQAVVRCADENGGCESAIITLMLMSANGGAGREVEIVHRWGNAHVTISEQDQAGQSDNGNAAHRALAKYLSNTVNNSCLATLAAAKAGQMQLASCAQERLQNLCGGNGPRSPAARAFSLRTWAVAFGRAGFEFIAQDQEATSRRRAVDRFSISGPLVISEQRPMAPTRLQVSGNTGVSRADLIVNDGGGNLNLQLIFAGQPNSHMRLNITSNFTPARADLHQVQK